MKICPKCNCLHDKSGTFCSRKCANSRTPSKETKEKMSLGVKNSKVYQDSLLKRETWSTERLKESKEKAKQRLLNAEFSTLSIWAKKSRVLLEQNNSCLWCGISEWRNQPIKLHLDHINGNRDDNSRYNLRCLCPNCHSQTETFCGRNKTNRKKISDEEIIAAYKESKNIRQTLILLGMTVGKRNYERVKRLCSGFV